VVYCRESWEGILLTVRPWRMAEHPCTDKRVPREETEWSYPVSSVYGNRRSKSSLTLIDSLPAPDQTGTMAERPAATADVAKLLQWNILNAIARYRDDIDGEMRRVHDKLWQYRQVVCDLRDEVAVMRAVVESVRATSEMILAALSRRERASTYETPRGGERARHPPPRDETTARLGGAQ